MGTESASRLHSRKKCRTQLYLDPWITYRASCLVSAGCLQRHKAMVSICQMGSEQPIYMHYTTPTCMSAIDSTIALQLSARCRLDCKNGCHDLTFSLSACVSACTVS